MKRLQFEDYEYFAYDIIDKFDSLDDKYGDIAIIAQYNEANQILKELLCFDYNIASVELHREQFENYYDEYIICLNSEGVWCEKFKRETGYFIDESDIIYILDNCSSNIIPYCKSENLYEVSVGESNDFENDDEEAKSKHIYTVNGKTVDKETFDNYVSKFAPDLVNNEKETSDDDSYSISVKCNLDVDEALELITDMERRILHMNDMFREMRCLS